MSKWVTKKLGNISEMCLGKMLDVKKNKGNFEPYLANVNVRWGAFDFSNLNQMRFEKSEQDRYGLKYGDLVICEGGEPGRCAIWRDEIPRMKIQKALHRVRVNSDFSNQFVFYRLLLAGKNGELNKHFIGSTIKHLTGIGLTQVEFSYPPFEEQQKIAAVLSALDAKIDCNNRINVELEAMAKTLYDYWFVQFDFPFDFAQDKPDKNGKPYKSSGGKMVYNLTLKRKIPVGWGAASLASITSVSNESLNPADFPYQEFKYFSIPVFDASKTYVLEYGGSIGSNKFTVLGKDLLVSKLNPWFSRVVYVMDEVDQICSTEFVVWRCPTEKLKNFLYLIATSQQFISHCVQSATGTSNSHKRVNPTVMMRFDLPYQNEIAEKFGEIVEPFIKKMVDNQRENQHLAQLRDWLLPMLMNGQVTVV